MNNRHRLALLLLSIILLALTTNAVQTDSSNYQQSVIISDGGSTNTSSSSYKQSFSLGDIIGKIFSTSYDLFLGFFYGVAGFIPSVVLNTPLNDSFHTVSYVLLNATVTDADNQPLDIYVWGANTTSQLDAGSNSLLYVLKNVPDTLAGINITYNWTAPVIQPDNSDAGTVLLMHFDNRSQFGETTEGLSNKTNDFSQYGNDGTIYGATFNSTGGKFAGAFEFDGADDYMNNNIITLTGTGVTISAWVNAKRFQSSPPYISTLAGIEEGSGGDTQTALIRFGDGDLDMDLTQFVLADSSGTQRKLNGVTPLNTGSWYHVAGTYNGSVMSLYLNGVLDNSNPSVLSGEFQGTGTFYISYSVGSRYLYGTIDEVAIWNRSLSADEILNLYQLKSSKYYWKVNVTDSSKQTSESQTREFTIDTTNPRINSSINNSVPKRFEVINISANVTDEYALRSCQFIHNQSGPSGLVYENRSVSENDDKCSQNFTITLPRDNVINFTVIAYDTANNTKQSEYITTVANTPPPKVTLRFPQSNNYTINRTPTFGWYNVTDADNDSLLFNIYIECVACSIDNRDVNTTTLNYTPSELLFLGDDNYFYNWSVRAIDNSSNGVTSFGDFSEEWNITINSYVSLSLLTSEVDFGSVLSFGDNDNTTDDSPGPIIVDNDGNVNETVSIYAEDDLWNSAPNPTDKFRFKIGNTTENNAFNWSGSITNWTNLPNSIETAVVTITSFDYHDTNDSAEVDLYVKVPTDEPFGEKQSKIVFEDAKS